MNNYWAFIKKELLEYTRTYKLLIMLMVFAVFGITNPLMAKLLPDILVSIMSDSIPMTLPEASAYDSWTQFFKNATQMGLLVMGILFSSVLSSELSKGTLINMLTKGLSRTAVIFSKYTCMILVWSISIGICFLLTYSYTAFLFPADSMFHVLFSTFCLWLFGVFLLAVLLFAATLTKSNYGCLLITGVLIVIFKIVNIIPKVHRYNPISLATDNLRLITNDIPASSLNCTILTACLLSLFYVMLAVLVFRKKQL